jgi:Fe-S-cluster containining protein
MKEIAAEHATADRYIAKAFADNPSMTPCCRAGCSACCSEPLWASEAEVLHILEMLTPEQIEEIKLKLPAWLKATRPLMDEKECFGECSYNFSLAYRRLNAPCVLLKNNLCSVYPRRPFGCRTWFALKNPEHCQLPDREHQQFAYFTDDLFRAVGSMTFVNDRLVLDHLGILLAEKLLGLTCPSASRQTDTANRLFDIFPRECQPCSWSV